MKKNDWIIIAGIILLLAGLTVSACVSIPEGKVEHSGPSRVNLSFEILPELYFSDNADVFNYFLYQSQNEHWLSKGIVTYDQIDFIGKYQWAWVSADSPSLQSYVLKDSTGNFFELRIQHLNLPSHSFANWRFPTDSAYSSELHPTPNDMRKLPRGETFVLSNTRIQTGISTYKIDIGNIYFIHNGIVYQYNSSYCLQKIYWFYKDIRCTIEPEFSWDWSHYPDTKETFVSQLLDLDTAQIAVDRINASYEIGRKFPLILRFREPLIFTACASVGIGCIVIVFAVRHKKRHKRLNIDNSTSDATTA